MRDKITHIVPRFLPQIDGLGDYGRLLAMELKRSHGYESRCIVGDPEWEALAKPPLPMTVTAVRRRTADELLSQLGDADLVILHYVGYGYHSRGVPAWIPRALHKWKKGGASRRLVVIFHELWASGPPWRSEFYLSLIQRRHTRELHLMCDAAMTSVPTMVRMLDKIKPGKTAFQPIPSNLPTLQLNQRTLHRGGPIRVIAFGQETSRLLSIRAHEKLLRRLHAEGLLGTVRVVGKAATAGASPSEDVRLLRTFLPGEKIEAAANVSPQQGAELLGQSDLFLSYYPAELLCKSGALMAALGCGCVPILPDSVRSEPLQAGVEFLACDGSEEQIAAVIGGLTTVGLADIATAGWQWYAKTASLPVVAATVAGLLKSQRQLSNAFD